MSIPCRSENSGGGGVRREEKESSERMVSVALRREASVSSLLLLLLPDDNGMDESHFHGRIVVNTTTGRFSFLILDMRSGMAIDPWPTGSRWRNNRMTVFGCVDKAV